MATIQHKSHDKTVATIAERNNLNPRTPGMMVLVRDAIGDPYAGSGRAVYRWDDVQASWILMFKDNVETLTFTGESKTISQDHIQLSFVPANGQVWDVMVRDGLVVQQVEHSVAGSVVTIYPNVPGEFDGKQLSVRYAYGTMTQQLDLEIARVVSEAVGVFDKEALGLGNVDNTSDASKPVSTAVQTALDAKQDTLVSGTNIKTVSGQSILGTGDIAAGLSNFTESISTEVPNDTTNAIALTVNGTATDIDFCMRAKGNGALLAQVPDEAVTGGNKRGRNATDFQQKRGAATQVAGGNYSVISGGYNNTASVDYSVIGGGSNNTASGYASMLGGGTFNTASGQRSVITGGEGNTASGITATVSGGRYNLADGNNSTVPGGNRATTNGISGLLAYGFNSSSLGESQMSFWGGRAFTGSATSTRMTAEGLSASATNQLTLRNNSVFRVRGTVVARNTSTNGCKEWTFEALIKRGTSAAATAIVGTPSITSTFADTAAASWSIAVTADTTNGALAVTATGAASTNIRWTAVVHSIEVA